MRPVLFKIGSITIYSYGFSLAVAFIAGFFICAYELQRKKIDVNVVYDLVIAAIIGGIIGAKLFYIFARLDFFIEFPRQVFSIREGLVLYGGVAGGALAVCLIVLRKKISLPKMADIAAPCLAFGIAIGRVGCFLNGCCYGKPSSLFWAIEFPELSHTRHPTQIYHILFNLVIFGIIWKLRRKIDKDGMIFWIYLLLYSMGRFSVEFFRVSVIVLWGLTAAQLISIGLFLVSLIVLSRNYLFRNFH